MPDQRIAELFRTLHLAGWTIAGKARQGGQAQIVRVRHTDGRAGIFRTLKHATPKSIARFKREIAILSDPRFRHRNIVELYEHSQDADVCWYISRLGRPFSPHWAATRESFAGRAAAMVDAALDCVAKLADGLVRLHENGVVHRDIKPRNIVEVDGEPVLIDFGLAYDRDSPRLSSEAEGVGNRRFSHDSMRYHLDDVNPWLDIYELSQLLMWMIAEQPGTDWPRPVDYRYIKYPEDLPPHLTHQIRALTATCSEEQFAPRDARAFLTVLPNFFSKRPPPSVDSTGLAVQIREFRQKGEDIARRRFADTALRDVDRLRLISASVDVFVNGCDQMFDVFDGTVQHFSSVPGVYAERLLDDRDKLPEWVDTILGNHANIGYASELPLVHISVGYDKTKAFLLRFWVQYWRPDPVPASTDNGPECFPAQLIPFTIDIRAMTPSRGPYLKLYIGHDCAFYDEGFKQLDLNEIRRRVDSLLRDESLWVEISSAK